MLRRFYQRCNSLQKVGWRGIQSKPNPPGVVNSIYDELDIPNENLCDFFLKRADIRKELPAIVCGYSGQSITYSEVASQTRKIGGGLIDSGLKVGSKAALMLPNIPEFGPILYACLGIGTTIVPVSPLLTPSELNRILNLSTPEAIFTLKGMESKINEVLPQLKVKPQVFYVDEENEQSAFKQLIKTEESKFDKREDFDLDEEVAVLPFSSGTTGLPKGVMLTHKNIMANDVILNCIASGCAVEPYFPGTGEPQPSVYSVIPLYHIYGLTCNIIQPLSAGITVILLPKFEPELFMKVLSTYKPNFLNLVPPLVSFIAHNPAVQRDVHLTNCRTISSGGSPLGIHTIKALEQKIHPFPIVIKEGFGMSECPLVMRTKVFTPGSVGKIINNTKIKIVDPETGVVLGPNQPGELCIKGPQVMKGYYENENATKEALKDGWLHTGDILYYDDEQNFYVVDRIKDMIKVKGFQVSPTELEDEIKNMDGVFEVSVIGVQHDKFGEAPKAFIVRSDPELTEQMIYDWLKDKVAHYKQLSGGIVFIQELPKSPTGKVLRKELKQLQ